jgi:lipopolysaccharide/colanic/teichoic acid biosynthesis glycosyltransferase
VGLYGKKFMFLKFRTMYVGNDSRVHEEYIKKLIAGKIEAEGGDGASQKPVYKITNDKRVTPIGELLRKTSLDELPQFINVLFGDMSLVGPRPPIPYEVQNYDIWHRCRVVEVKPGITGLWQVMGRSTTSFDEMVRLDIKYSREWSLWLDLKIIVMTPWSVIRGKGAY